MCYARSARGSRVPPATCIWPWPVDLCLGVQRLGMRDADDCNDISR